jgi:hypothetical protein
MKAVAAQALFWHTPPEMLSRIIIATTLSIALVGCQQAPPPPQPEISNEQMAQVDRLWTLVESAEQEYQRLFTDTTYPTDSEKTKATEWIQSKESMFHIVRLLHADLVSKRTRLSLAVFTGSTLLLVDNPESTFTRYDFSDRSLKDGKQVYGNLSKIQSIVSEYKVILLSAMREMK